MAIRRTSWWEDALRYASTEEIQELRRYYGLMDAMSDNPEVVITGSATTADITGTGNLEVSTESIHPHMTFNNEGGWRNVWFYEDEKPQEIKPQEIKSAKQFNQLCNEFDKNNNPRKS